MNFREHGINSSNMVGLMKTDYMIEDLSYEEVFPFNGRSKRTCRWFIIL